MTQILVTSTFAWCYSPGGMADGVQIQDRDPLTVPSTRRNPLLADIFNRLGYMERKGSGFEKIINGYEFQVTFDESKKPRFYSDRSQFRTIMPNLNYGFDEKQLDGNINLNGSENGSEKRSESGSEKRAEINASNKRKIIVLINQNNKISQEMLAEQLGVTRRVVQRLLKELIDEEKVKRVGPDKGGHWEIIE